MQIYNNINSKYNQENNVITPKNKKLINIVNGLTSLKETVTKIKLFCEIISLELT